MSEKKIIKFEDLGDTVMPILGFWGPWDAGVDQFGNKYPHLRTDEVYKLAKEAGINITQQSNDSYPERKELVEQALDFCQPSMVGGLETNELTGSKFK